LLFSFELFLFPRFPPLPYLTVATPPLFKFSNDIILDGSMPALFHISYVNAANFIILSLDLLLEEPAAFLVWEPELGYALLFAVGVLF
jgi:hypothetical protein